ncbi:MAG: guanylate kinase [Deltaproteobacteria bacterium]|jgi:guanylate kinase|nr:guanylate kinase [Deltaproteobacteria bacterium]
MTGSLYVISAPSGAGKTSTIRALFDRRMCPRLEYSVSYTTRKPRPREEDGRDYNFIDQNLFLDMIEKDGFLEWTKVFDRYYGTGRDWVLSRLNGGKDVLVDVDVVGAGALRERYPEAILIFLVPPTFEELARRLINRRTEDPEEVHRRLAQASWEIDRRMIFNYLVINDCLEEAVAEVERILLGGKGRRMADEEEFWPKFFRKPKSN